MKNHAADKEAQTAAPAETSAILESPPVAPSIESTESTPESKEAEIVMPPSAPPAPAGAPALETFKPPMPEIGASPPDIPDDADESLWKINQQRGLTEKEIREITKECKKQFKGDMDALRKCASDMGEEYKKTQPAPPETASPDVEVGEPW